MCIYIYIYIYICTQINNYTLYIIFVLMLYQKCIIQYYIKYKKYINSNLQFVIVKIYLMLIM